MKTFKELFLELYQQEKDNNGMIDFIYTHQAMFNSIMDNDEQIKNPSEEEIYEDLYYILKNYDDFETIICVEPQNPRQGFLKYVVENKISIKSIPNNDGCEELLRSLQTKNYKKIKEL